jgi:hypothetical protein
MTDFRALCAELADWIHEETRTSSGIPHPLVAQARAALAQPEPQGPTDAELITMWATTRYIDQPEGGLAYGRAVLARWGRPTIEPVPVSERLPGPEDCDSEGRCWWLDRPSKNGPAAWILRRPDDGLLIPFLAWLPHWALPVPGVEGEP